MTYCRWTIALLRVLLLRWVVALLVSSAVLRAVPRTMLVVIRVRHDEFFEGSYRREKKLDMDEVQFFCTEGKVF